MLKSKGPWCPIKPLSRKPPVSSSKMATAYEETTMDRNGFDSRTGGNVRPIGSARADVATLTEVQGHHKWRGCLNRNPSGFNAGPGTTPAFRFWFRVGSQTAVSKDKWVRSPPRGHIETRVNSIRKGRRDRLDTYASEGE